MLGERHSYDFSKSAYLPNMGFATIYKPARTIIRAQIVRRRSAVDYVTMYCNYV